MRAAAVERFGEPWVRALEASAGCHTEAGGAAAPAAGEERLIFALLEAVDFECPVYAWNCSGRVSGALAGVSLADVQAFLREHRTAVLASRVAPPSWRGLLSGTFDFLREEQG